MFIAVDFDGTCVKHKYPAVGEDIGAVPILKELVKNGHSLILFTMRSDKEGISPVTNDLQQGGLVDAISWFVDNNILLSGIQCNPTQASWTSSPKCYAHIYIDDAALGCPLIYPEGERPYVNWKKVRQLLKKQGVIK